MADGDVELVEDRPFEMVVYLLVLFARDVNIMQPQLYIGNETD